MGQGRTAGGIVRAWNRSVALISQSWGVAAGKDGEDQLVSRGPGPWTGGGGAAPSQLV